MALIEHQHIRADLKPLLPEWLANRLRTLAKSLPNPNEAADPEDVEKAPRYEASTYGPMNASLTLFFPTELSFMVKPQPRIRKPLTPAQVASGKHARNVSTDSYNNIVHINDKDPIPDFIVCRGGAGLHDDTPLMIVEVKRHGETFADHEEQVAKYTAWAQREGTGGRMGSNQIVMLVVGSETRCLSIAGEEEPASITVDTWGWDMFEIWQQLRQASGAQAASAAYPPRPAL
ncbi:uncharacterized protein PHACADRAFT_264028, partial [Phanerochaete carnosa HHB-10118-sp]